MLNNGFSERLVYGQMDHGQLRGQIGTRINCYGQNSMNKLPRKKGLDPKLIEHTDLTICSNPINNPYCVFRLDFNDFSSSTDITSI